MNRRVIFAMVIALLLSVFHFVFVALSSEVESSSQNRGTSYSKLADMNSEVITANQLAYIYDIEYVEPSEPNEAEGKDKDKPGEIIYLSNAKVGIKAISTVNDQYMVIIVYFDGEKTVNRSLKVNDKILEYTLSDISPNELVFSKGDEQLNYSIFTRKN